MRHNTEYAGQGAELVPGSLRGYRQWQPAQGGLLASLSMSYVWPETTVEATCLKHQQHYTYNASYHNPLLSPGHDVPQRSCSCGIYAKHQTDGIVDSYYNSYISGVIEAWGRVELGSEGFRAQKARIIALAMPKVIIANEYAEFMRILGQRYKGITFYPTIEPMIEAYPPIDVSTLVPKEEEPKPDPFLDEIQTWLE